MRLGAWSLRALNVLSGALILGPVLIVVLVYLLTRSARRAARYALLFLAAAFFFYVGPFLLFGWSAAPLRKFNSQFTMTGTIMPPRVSSASFSIAPGAVVTSTSSKSTPRAMRSLRAAVQYGQPGLV